MHRDCVSDFETHQIFADFKRTRVVSSGGWNQICGAAGHDVCVDRELRLEFGEDCTGDLRSCVVSNNRLHALSRHGGVVCSKRVGIDHFVNQEIYALRVPYQVLGVSSISREHCGMSSEVNSVSKGRFHYPVIDKERGDLYAVAVVDDGLADVVSDHCYSLARQSVIYLPNVSVELIGFREVRHHGCSPGRSPDLQRSFAPAVPSTEPEIWYSDGVIRVQMREEQGIDFSERNFELLNPLSGATAAIEEQDLLTRFDQDTGAEAVHPGLWRSSSEERHLEVLAGCGGGESKARDKQCDCGCARKLVENLHG